MRQSRLFAKTLKKVSGDIKLISHKYLLQAGFIRESAAGRYYYLPLGLRVRDKIVRVVEEEMDKTGALKILAPILHPLELWKETSRTESVGFELMTVKDRSKSEFALGGTAEEMMVDLVRRFTVSYKDLPFHIYQFSPKFRDEMRARGGLLRLREFLMKDGYSFHADEEDFKKEYRKIWETYARIFNRLELQTVVVESDNGYIGGDYCHEFVVEDENGESGFLISADGNYAAHEDVAKFRKDAMNPDEPEAELKEIDAPRGRTMEDGANLHNLPLWRQIKDVMFIDDKGRYILAVIRGDLDVNETKLLNLAKANGLRMASEEEIRSLGSEPGFISPVNIGKNVIIVADDSLKGVKNGYGGANKKNRDLLNVNMGRDFKPDIIGDIAMAKDGYASWDGQRLAEGKGIEVGNIFQLGLHYSEKMKAVFVDKDGQEKFFYMGCYGIGIDRTLATIIEKHHDERGMIWPKEIAPFQVHLLALGKAGSPVLIQADELYDSLKSSGLEVLYDDRTEVNAGEKFADSDLIGCPLRLVVSEKSLAQGAVELKQRDAKEARLIKIDELMKEIV